MSDNYDHIYRRQGLLSQEIRHAMLIIDIERILNQRNLTLYQYAISPPTEQLRDICTSLSMELYIAQQSPLEQELSSYNMEQELDDYERNYEKLGQDQKRFVDSVRLSVNHNSGKIFFLDAIAGAGKTFCENILLSYTRSIHKVAIAVATTGIAATLLKNGRTAQSAFHLPLQTEDNCVWNITAQSKDAELLSNASLIIWDEVTMAHRHLIEALDIGLRDITQINKPFGGKTIVLAGDFRQALPIIQHGSRAQIVKSTLKRSRIWKNMEIHRLLVNHRCRLNGINQEAEQYAQWLLSVGNGTTQTTPNDTYDDLITIPDTILMEGTIMELADWVFENLFSDAISNTDQICQRAILTPKNIIVKMINDIITDKFPGEKTILPSADTLLAPEYYDTHVPNEFLNTLNPPGLPPHQLPFKIGMPLILLRNLNPSIGLSNGTKLSLLRIQQHTLDVKIIGGQHHGRIVCLP